MNEIPSEIAQIIEHKHQALLEAKRQKEEAEKRQAEETLARGKAKFDSHVESALQKVPEWIRPYHVPGVVDYERIANGWDRVEYTPLNFSIPGLPLVQFRENDSAWRCSIAQWDPGEGWAPHLDETSGWSTDPEYIVARAKKELHDHEENLVKYSAQAEERARKQAEREHLEQAREAFERENEARLDQERQKEQAEEQALFDALKNDPVAMAMLKAFVMIHQERSGLRSQIEDMNDSMYSMENYWSGRAEELRRQASDAQRRADEERDRVSSLQSDLDDAEKKLKRAERGW